MSGAAGSAPLASRRRALVHLLVLAAGWLLFVWLWWLVFRAPWAVRDLMLLVVAALLLFPAVTLWWVWHNRAIYRRRGPRRGLRHVTAAYQADFNGRRIDADWATLQAAPEVHIHIEGDVKRFAARAGA